MSIISGMDKRSSVGIIKSFSTRPQDAYRAPINFQRAFITYKLATRASSITITFFLCFSLFFSLSPSLCFIFYSFLIHQSFIKTRFCALSRIQFSATQACSLVAKIQYQSDHPFPLRRKGRRRSEFHAQHLRTCLILAPRSSIIALAPVLTASELNCLMRASPFSVLFPRTLAPQNKVRITRSIHRRSLSLSPARSFFSITPHLPGKIMPVHISPALSARPESRPSAALCFLPHRRGCDRCPESLPADASYADVAI